MADVTCCHPDGCPRPPEPSRHGWCSAHAHRIRKTGSPGPAAIRLKINDWEAAFRARVDKRGPSECWPWLGLKTKGGYGIYWPKGGNTNKSGVQRTTAHRIAYELDVGPIPDGMTLDHLKDRCSRRDCCNPAHLEPVTRGENNLRGNSPAARNARKTHCGNDHEYTPDNTYISPGSSKRRCRICTHDRYLSTIGTDRDAIAAEHGMVCHLCGDLIESRDDLHIDHVIPVNSGGAELGPENLLPAHVLCNLRKGATLPLF